MIKENKYCSDVMKKHFNKELAMTKKDNEDCENSTKCWICDNDVKIRDDCHITGYVDSDSNIHVKLNHEIPFVFRNLKKYDSHISNYSTESKYYDNSNKLDETADQSQLKNLSD